VGDCRSLYCCNSPSFHPVWLSPQASQTPSFDSVLFVILGAIMGVSGIKLLLNIRAINVTGDLYISIVIGGFASAWAGVHSLINGFTKAISESSVPPPEKNDEDNVPSEKL
jgi:hypothetical protein